MTQQLLTHHLKTDHLNFCKQSIHPSHKPSFHLASPTQLNSTLICQLPAPAQLPHPAKPQNTLLWTFCPSLTRLRGRSKWTNRLPSSTIHSVSRGPYYWFWSWNKLHRCHPGFYLLTGDMTDHISCHEAKPNTCISSLILMPCPVDSVELFQFSANDPLKATNQGSQAPNATLL